VLGRLARDSSSRVRVNVAGSPHAFPELFEVFLWDPDDNVRFHAARNELCPEKYLLEFVCDNSPLVRLGVAKNRKCPRGILELLRRDRALWVADCARQRLDDLDVGQSSFASTPFHEQGVEMDVTNDTFSSFANVSFLRIKTPNGTIRIPPALSDFYRLFSVYSLFSLLIPGLPAMFSNPFEKYRPSFSRKEISLCLSANVTTPPGILRLCSRFRCDPILFLLSSHPNADESLRSRLIRRIL